jgi:GH25 family lysozyme M1 (1,4-beta-N-acetylmuramidase)
VFSFGCKRENLSISHSEYIFGIDVSHYQGKIDWTKVKTSHHPIKFVFIRSTMGKDGVDTEFQKNWIGAKKIGLKRGAYHYYRPNENSTEQFNNFKNHVNIKKGDLYPVLDIEEMSEYGTGNLQKGVRNWLDLAEKEYGVRPIIYSGRSFYNKVLKSEFSGYPVWIASYSSKDKVESIDWIFHQFTDKVKVNGIPGVVDGNDFNGTKEELLNYCK